MLKVLKHNIILPIAVLIIASLSYSCVNITPSHEARLVDSLNQRAYNFLYKNPDVVYHCAFLAYNTATSYDKGRAEACNNLASVEFQRMNYEAAEKLYRQVYNITKNELEQTIADIGLMAIYQRTSKNKNFYDFRTSAKRRLKRIEENNSIYIGENERQRLNFAKTELQLNSATYHYYLQQHDETESSINNINVEDLKNDTAQHLKYLYIKGLIYEINNPAINQQNVMNDFDQFYDCWEISRKNYQYFAAVSMVQISRILQDDTNLATLKQYRPQQIASLGNVNDPNFVIKLLQWSQHVFSRFKDFYNLASTMVSMGEYYNIHDKYSTAIDSLVHGLNYISTQHSIYYPKQRRQWLMPFNNTDTTYTEIEWITNEHVKTAPECIARLREQLSVSYSGLNEKLSSDYNRNIYLDLLNYTRQDKELESRSKYLEHEDKLMTGISLTVLLALLLLIIVFLLINRRSKAKNKLYMERLHNAVDVCQKITASLNTDIEDADDVNEAVKQATSSINKNDTEMREIIQPYVDWTLKNGMKLTSLSDRRKEIEKQYYIVEQHIENNKRSNLIKKSCLSIVYGITPYIDRIINEIRKLTLKDLADNTQLKKGRFRYIDELVTKINEYNDILSLWIKVKQGSLNLNIESFNLNVLLGIVAKGKKAFETKHITLNISPTEVWVKADRSLTLFMINTLMENARKYTPEGGTVDVKVDDADDYAEISVVDNGPGMSADDVVKILGEKVYNSAEIGISGASGESIKKNKGYGFGLMNCKGIIEKYKKTSSLFKACMFGIDSTPGRGSRFFFRLPHGMKHLLVLVLIITGICSCSPHKNANIKKRKVNRYTYLLQRASNMADTAYYCNVMEKYQLALKYSDLAIDNLNEYYKKQTRHPKMLMTLRGKGHTAEVQWWNNMVESDYYVIIDIRNEAAVAFLALKDWKNYNYNNNAYSKMYKLVSEDYSLEDYCRSLKSSTNNKLVGIILLIIIITIGFIIYYYLYVHKRILNRIDLEQVMEINKQLLISAAQNDEEKVKDLFNSINELFPIDALALGVINDDNNAPDCAYSSDYNVWNKALKEAVMTTYADQKRHTSNDGKTTAIPLTVEIGNASKFVGIIALTSKNKNDAERYDLLISLICKYLGIILFNRVVIMASKYRDIESINEETQRAAYEEEQIHVQNMVLDNCLSTIKHETIYYPNRIKQITDRLQNEDMPADTEESLVKDMKDLIDYYKDIFNILSSCAARQLNEVTFRRRIVKINSLMTYANTYFKRITQKRKSLLELKATSINSEIIGDEILLKYLIENLIDEAVADDSDGILTLEAKEEEEYIRFLFTDHRRNRTQEELNQLFYPDLHRMNVDESGVLHGTEYLVCKQIIREHDEFSGHRGSRINAEVCAGGGFTVYFTIQKRRNKK